MSRCHRLETYGGAGRDSTPETEKAKRFPLYWLRNDWRVSGFTRFKTNSLGAS